MTRRIGLLLAMIGLLVLPATVGAHLLDHAPPTFSEPAPPGREFMSGGEDAEWEFVATLPTGNPLTDLDFFTHGGDTYASVGTLAQGANGGGQTIAQLTNGGQVDPRIVSSHPSASCLSTNPVRPQGFLGLQHDVEATPKGGAILNTFNPSADQRQAQLLVDATDAEGRCHDQRALRDAPRGGLELIDIADSPLAPKEIGLTSHIGESHTVNIDPRRPHIAYSVTSDLVSVVDGRRQNELETTRNALGQDVPNGARFNLDGFEVVDLASCMYFPAGTTVQQKRDACRPQVYRYRYPTLEMSVGHTNKGVTYGCHELEVYPDDRLTCGSGGSLIVLDMKGAFDDNGTPTNFTDDKLNGTPLACTVRDSSTVSPVPPGLKTGAKVTDCVDGTGTGVDDLSVARWLQDGAPSLQGVQHVGSVFHQGRNTSQQDQVDPAFPSTEDVDFDHEAEYTTSRRFLLATDERGGGVLPPGATCPTMPADNPNGNGGIHAYKAGSLRSSSPSPGEAFEAYARTPRGAKAIYRAPIRTQPQASLCTAHVFQQIPGQNRIFMGWYSQGTQVVDFTENPDGTIEFKEAGYFIPINANTWTSHVFKAQRNGDGSFTYWGATGDFNLGAQGRSAIDVYKVTLPAPPDPQGGTGTAGAPTGGSAGAGAGGEQCATVSGFRSVGVRRRGRGLRVNFARRSGRPVRVDVFRQTKGRRSITKLKRVKTFRSRRRSFTWNGRGRGVRDGYYVVRLRTGLADGSADLRRLAVRRRGGRFRVRPAFQRTDSCTNLVGSFRLNRPVFGGRQKRALFASFRLNQRADVKLTVTRNGKVVRTTTRRSYAAGNGRTLRLTPQGSRKGDYKVTISAERGTRSATATLTTRRL